MAELETFAAPRLIGDRFEGGVIPVEVLAELVAYRDLVLEVATALFKAEHDRQRVRRGFRADFQIALRHIGEGSAQAELVRPPSRKLPLPGLQSVRGPDVFERARDLVADTVAAVAAEKPPPSEFPPSLFGRFNAFGRRLGPNEAIELLAPGAERGPRYTPAVRKKLVFLGVDETVEEPVDVIAAAVAIHTGKENFTIKHDAREILVTLRPEDEETVLDAIRRRSEVRLHVTGVGARDRHDHLVRIGEVDAVRAVPVPEAGRTSVAEQVRHLRAVEKGWMDGEGEALSSDGVQWLEGLLSELVADGMPTPRLYPTLEGGVQAEWSMRGWEVSATFELESHHALLLAASTRDPNKDMEDEVDLDHADGPAKLAEWITLFEEELVA